MQRRDFIKQVGTYPLAAQGLAAAQKSLAGPAFQEKGARQVLDLAGPWELRMDLAGHGMSRKWFNADPPGSEAAVIPIEVPSVWQQYTDTDGGIAWYTKTFSLPPDLLKRALRVRFGAVDYRARVWLNGQEVGGHEGGFTPFELDVSRAARAGTNRLAVRVSDAARTFVNHYCGEPGWDRPSWHTIDGIDFDHIPAGFQDWREGFNHCGIWQGVEVIAHDPVYLADAFLLPKIASSAVEARLEIMNQTGKPLDTRLTLDIKPWKDSTANTGGTERSVRLDPGRNSVTLPVDLRQVHAWTPDDPFLYVLQVSLSSGSQRRDNVLARFGMRELTIGSDGFFQLNGKRIFLKGAHYQSTEPLTLAFPHNLEMARRIIEIAKEGGFNFMRHQGRPIAPSILDAADELGILLQSEPAVSRMPDHPDMEELALRETRELIQRDRNRPSIGIWNLINEQAAGMKVVYKMAQLARELDPTRIITESAGGPSHFYRPYSTEGVSYVTEHGYQGAPLSEKVLEYWRKRGVPGQLYFITEFGFGALEDIDAVLEKYGPNPRLYMEDYLGFVKQKKQVEYNFERTGAKEVFPDLAALREAAQTMQANTHKFAVESFRSNARVGGFNVVQLFDSNSNEVDGLVDFWRNKRKKSFYMFQQMNQPVQLILQFSPLNPKAGTDVQVDVTLVNEDRISGAKTLVLRATGPDGAELFSRSTAVDAQTWVTRLFSGKIPAGQQPGKIVLEAELREGPRGLLKKSEQLTVYHPREFAWPTGGFALFDPQNRWPGARSRSDIHVRNYDVQAERPELVVVPEFSGLWHQRAEFENFVHLIDQVRRGSTVLFLGIPSDGGPIFGQRASGNIFNFSSLTVAAVLGFSLSADGESDAWGAYSGPYGWAAGNTRSGSPVTRHAVFEGLPGPGLMDWEYGNIMSGRVPVPYRMSAEKTGPALPIIRLDDGKVVFCAFELLENLEQDGLAEKLLSNLVGYLHKRLPAQLRARTEREEETLQFHRRQVQDYWDKFLG
jgi:Glycosyl hydrolases family 2, sugar binding domain/Glycosyl hydrolases family 2, TIM barrel domain/Glycosyl hydrolases family 2